MASTSRIVELSNIISHGTAQIDVYLRENNLAQPSFEEHARLSALPENAPAHLQQAHAAAIEASLELQQLLRGVDSLLMPSTDPTSLTAISRFKIASQVPLDGEISFVELAEKSDMAEHDLRRIIRFAIVHHRVFREPRKGVVAHSAASRRLAESQTLRSVVGMSVDEVWPAQARTVDALVKFGKSQEPNASGFALANNTDLPFYEYLEAFPERAQQFGGAMSGAGIAGLQALVDHFPWSNLPDQSLVVDLGGSQGHVSAFVADAVPSLRFIVQDLPKAISGTDSAYRIPNSMGDRVTLMAHDFFSPQPVEGVDVFLIRYIFHNWSDEYCVKILRNLRPGLKTGSRIVIQDHLMLQPGSLPLMKERDIRSMDLIMLSLFNSRERDEDDWKTLVENADPGFKFESAKRQAENSPSGIIIVSWNG
ncbi:putative O-methyltransferase [Amylocarpus encephaloides]|uniref:O-methyltransferase n=1 Tax=Amylocarpus encephaloides TaxID=45428 RepID=A0A9P7YCH7_9HELO|nr:putative O-methyltransferase [Amylocarpus encephaloides]